MLCSYGFRPKRSDHRVLKGLRNGLAMRLIRMFKTTFTALETVVWCVTPMMPSPAATAGTVSV